MDVDVEVLRDAVRALERSTPSMLRANMDYLWDRFVTNPKEKVEILPGQTWEDKDKRMQGRRVMVSRVDEVYAYCRSATTGEQVRLLKRRMGQGSGTRGWKLVQDEVSNPTET